MPIDKKLQETVEDLSQGTNVKRLTKEEQKEMDALPTKSGKIRYLDSKQFTTVQIANELGIIYQHARNVLNTPLKRKKKPV